MEITDVFECLFGLSFLLMPELCSQILNCFLEGVDPCEVWCNQPVDILREYCNIIKIRIFWPLLFNCESDSLVAGWR